MYGHFRGTYGYGNINNVHPGYFIASTFIIENDGRYCLTEKYVYDEMLYVTRLKSAKELYGEPLRRMDILSVEEYDLIFDKLLKVADECCRVINEVCIVFLSLYIYIMTGNYERNAYRRNIR